MGTGNCGIAALKNSRRFVGIEKNPEIFKTAKENLDFYSENGIFKSILHTFFAVEF